MNIRGRIKVVFLGRSLPTRKLIFGRVPLICVESDRNFCSRNEIKSGTVNFKFCNRIRDIRRAIGSNTHELGIRWQLTTQTLRESLLLVSAHRSPLIKLNFFHDE